MGSDPRWRVLVFGLSLAVVVVEARGAVLFGLDQGSTSSTLRISTGTDVGVEVIAFETVGLVLGDRVELRYAAGLVFEGVATPVDWGLQVTTELVLGQAVGVASYTYLGRDAGSDAEFYRFGEGWAAEFRLLDLAGTGRGEGILEATLFARAVVSGVGLVAFREQSEFSSVAIFAVPEPGRALYFLAALTAVAAGRRRNGGGG